MSSWMVGVDTGGTFTDLVAFNNDTGEVQLAKVPSYPPDPSRAVLAAVDELVKRGIPAKDIEFFAHGTTVGTNAPRNSPSGLIPSGPKLPRRMEYPAGLGALAMTVRPPPTTAPATSEYFIASVKVGTWDPRNVRAALSVMAVNATAPK